jgi:hypothetical protein
VVLPVRPSTLRVWKRLQKLNPSGTRQKPSTTRQIFVHRYLYGKKIPLLTMNRGRKERTATSPQPSPPAEEREKARAVHGSNARLQNVEVRDERVTGAPN